MTHELELPHPSFAAGFARSAAESAFPELWDGLFAAWAPVLGVQGVRLQDVARGKRTGSPVNAPTWAMSAIGPVLNFVAASSQYVTLSPLIPLHDDFTIEALLKPIFVSDGASKTILASTVANQKFQINDNIGGGVTYLIWRVYSGGNHPMVVGATNAISGKWQHVAVTVKRDSDIFLYLNGRQDGNGTDEYSYRSSFGRIGYILSEIYNGQIAYLAYWNRALPPSQILDLKENSLALWTPAESYASKPSTTTIFAGGWMDFDEKRQPSFATGWAKSQAESVAPELWRGLVGAWVPALGGQGQQVVDASGRKNIGICTNGPTWVTGKYGTGIASDGGTQFVKIGPLAGRTYPNYPITLACLFRLTSAPNDNDDVFSVGGDLGSGSALMALEFYTGELNYRAQWFSSVSVQSGVTPTVGRWYFAVGVSRADNAHEIYVDGVRKGTNNSSAGNTVTAWNRGAVMTRYWQSTPDTGNTPPVQVAMAAVWQRALRASEIEFLNDYPLAPWIPAEDWVTMKGALPGPPTAYISRTVHVNLT